MEALEIFEGGLCECGFHESLTHDRSNHFTFDQKVCPVCRGLAKYARIQADADQKAEKALGEDPPASATRLSDGRRTFLRRMSPLEVAALEVKRSAPNGG